MFQWYHLGGATLGGHMLRVSDGKLKAALEARVANSMAALELRRLAGGKLIIHANHALDTVVGQHLTLVCNQSWRSTALTI